MFVKWVAFLSALHWPQDGTDLGVGGVSYVELLILYELWAGERLSLEKAHPRYLRPGRPISVSAVPFGPGTDIWRSCGCIGALCSCWFACDRAAGRCRLRHLVWEKSWPRESASESFLKELLVLFGFPSGSAAALLGGELPLRYCSGEFACRIPTWVFLFEVMFRVLLLSLVVFRRCRGVATSLVLSCLALLMVLGCLVAGDFFGVLKEFGDTGKPQHTLQVSSTGLGEIEG